MKNYDESLKAYQKQKRDEKTSTIIDELDELFGYSKTDKPKVNFSTDLQADKTPAEKILEVAQSGTVEQFKELQASGADHNIQECLDWAVNSDNFAIIQEIVEAQGTKPNCYACATAIRNGSDFLLEYLFEHGADVHENGDSLVYQAAKTNHLYLPYLAELGASNYTAIVNDFIDNTDVAIYMLDNGAVPNLETLSRASHTEDNTVLTYLLTDKGMVPPKQQWIDGVDESFAENKLMLSKALLKEKMLNKFKVKTKGLSL